MFASFFLFDVIDCVPYCSTVMKKKALKKGRGVKKIVKNALAAASSPQPEVVTTFPPSFTGGPPPEVLFLEAEQEPDNRELGQYLDSIRVLRGKSFSYREIAEWLSERGVNADHNSVYRVYTKSLSDWHAHLEAEREADEERDEAERNR